MGTATAGTAGTQARTPTLSRSKMHHILLWEDVRRINGPLKVDADKGIIYGVKILGWDSANGRRYLPEAAQKALSLYEGAKVFTNHPDPEKRNRPRLDDDGFGRLKDVNWKPDGLYGDLHYFKSHPMAGRICEDVQRAIGFFGLSHNADGVSKREDGVEVIQEITAVRSVDIVTDAATTSNLWESKHMAGTAATGARTTFRKLMENALIKGAYKRKLREAMDDGMVQPDMEVDEPDGDEAPKMGADDAVDAAFNAALHGIVDDTSLDSKAKSAKLKQLLSIQEKLAGKKTAEGAESDKKDGDDKDGKQEGKQGGAAVDPTIKQLQEQVAALTRSTKVRQACDSASFIPTPVQLRALEAVGEKDMDDLIESFQAAAKTEGVAGGAGGHATNSRLPFTPQRPKTSGLPVTESKTKPITEAKGDEAATRKARLTFLRSGSR